MELFYIQIVMLSFIYLFVTFSQYALGKRAGVEENWQAFIPVFNVIHFFKIAGMSFFKFILFFFISSIPFILTFFMVKRSPLIFPMIFVSIVLLLLLLIFYSLAIPMKTASNIDYPAVSGLLLLVPVISLYTISLFAFHEEKRFLKLVASWVILTIFLASPAIWFNTDRGKELIAPIQQKIIKLYQNKLEISEKQKRYLLKNFARMGISFGDEEYDDNELMITSEKFYVWTDLKGNDHYVSVLDDIPSQFRDSAKEVESTSLHKGFSIMTKEEEGEALLAKQGAPIPEQLKFGNFDIKLYSYTGDKNLAETEKYFKKFNLPYKIYYVDKDPAHATELKQKLGLDINKKYNNINYPVIDIDERLVLRIIEAIDENDEVSQTSLDTKRINTILGLRATFE